MPGSAAARDGGRRAELDVEQQHRRGGRERAGDAGLQRAHLVVAQLQAALLQHGAERVAVVGRGAAHDPVGAGERVEGAGALQRLRRGEVGPGAGSHARIVAGRIIGTRGSGTCSGHEPRTQACAGSSEMAIERTSPGPASTFRYHIACSGLAAHGPW